MINYWKDTSPAFIEVVACLGAPSQNLIFLHYDVLFKKILTSLLRTFSLDIIAELWLHHFHVIPSTFSYITLASPLATTPPPLLIPKNHITKFLKIKTQVALKA